ncbi:hypothetical protein KGA66_01855 [Actinocrinis puniceicyclus]|uniref:Uncharacterized protein n=1 Tax=Actinocrinis puniceicyclus TaxID=977794 RepID=A0A8J7WIY4_9ACTN|nr:hypothetical protein [Actinocrinis puniceicyclus]MBS2961775.1 hypothetical protein [Actinocrinis puniceicyclus]
MPIPSEILSRALRTAPGKAVAAAGAATAVVVGVMVAFPPIAAAASGSPDLVIRPTHSRIPFPTFSFPLPTATGGPTGGTSVTVPVRVKKSTGTGQSSGQFNYVSTFSPAPVASSSPVSTASAACLPNGQPVTGPGGALDLPGISGTSKDPGHVGALPITDLGPMAMLPPQIDSTNLTQLRMTRPVDAVSPNLSMVASSGYRFPCVHIEVGAGRGYANAEYALVNAGLVADDRSGGSEILTWTYSTILWSYTLPGSADVHQGSGEINAQPDHKATSLATDSKKVAAGTVGLALLVAFGLIALYVAGRRRNRQRYRTRYYRRAVLRAQRAAAVAGAAEAVPSQQAVAESLVVEPDRPARPDQEFVEAVESAEAVEPVEVHSDEAAQAAESETEAAEAEPESEPDPEPVPEPEPEPESIPEPELEAEPESVLEPEPEPESIPEPELEAEPESVSDLELEAEPESVLEPEPEPESIPEPDPEPVPEPEPEPEPAAAEAEADFVQGDERSESDSVALDSAAPDPDASIVDEREAADSKRESGDSADDDEAVRDEAVREAVRVVDPDGDDADSDDADSSLPDGSTESESAEPEHSKPAASAEPAPAEPAPASAKPEPAEPAPAPASAPAAAR